MRLAPDRCGSRSSTIRPFFTLRPHDAAHAAEHSGGGFSDGYRDQSPWRLGGRVEAERGRSPGDEHVLVSSVDPEFDAPGRSVQIPNVVPSGPGAIAAPGNSVWVAPSTGLRLTPMRDPWPVARSGCEPPRWPRRTRCQVTWTIRGGCQHAYDLGRLDGAGTSRRSWIPARLISARRRGGCRLCADPVEDGRVASVVDSVCFGVGGWEQAEQQS
jgi:hypothetical protein